MYNLVIIEDEVKILEALKKFIPFESLGLNLIASATNGLDGLKCIETTHPDIVITDITMPQMSGIEMLQCLNDKKLKIILLTAHADFKYAQAAISFGVIEYLLKPVFPADVVKALKKCIKLLDSEKSELEADTNMKNVSTIIAKMKKYAENNFREITLNKLVDYLGFSESYLRKLFKDETGITFKQYLISVRMEKAKELLESNYYKIYEIADMVGYNDVATFRDSFKKYFGTTPRDI